MANNKAKWYIVQVVSNYEQKVKQTIEERDFEESGNTATIKDILLPLVNHTTKTGNKKKKPMFPGYLFVKVEMTDESWFIIRNTPYVTGIVGSSGHRTKPTPIPNSQIDKIIEKIKEESTKIITELSAEKNPVKSVDFKENDQVDILSGDFVNHVGKVISISIPKQSIMVEVEFFGRLTTIEIPISIVEKKT